MRQLKHHEQKLLKKVNFLQWKSDQNVREIKVLRRYHVQVPRPLLSPAIEPPCPPHPTPLSGCWSYILVYFTLAHAPLTAHTHNPRLGAEIFLATESPSLPDQSLRREGNL